MLNGVDDALVIPGEVDVGDRRQRIHDRDEIERSHLVLNEFGQRLTDGERAAKARVVVVQENDEHARVVTRGFPFLIVSVANLLRRWFTRLRVAVDFDEPKRFDLLRLVVLEDVEIRLLQIRGRLSLRVGHVRIHRHEVDARTEGQLRLVSRLLLGVPLLGAEGKAAGERQGKRYKKCRRNAHSNHHNPEPPRLL